MKAKVLFGEDIRHWHYPMKNRYENLNGFVEERLKLNGEKIEKIENKNKKKQEYYFQFEDAENDKIRICNEQDLLDAFECAQQENRPSLKIFVVFGPINNNSDNNNNSSSTSTSTSTNKSTSTSTSQQVPSQKKENNNDVKNSEEKCHAFSSPINGGCNWRKAIMEFLLDEKLKKVLPELVKRVIHALHENKRNGQDVSLAEIVPSVLEEKQFEDIVQHESYQNYLQPFFAFIINACYAFCSCVVESR